MDKQLYMQRYSFFKAVEHPQVIFMSMESTRALYATSCNCPNDFSKITAPEAQCHFWQLVSQWLPYITCVVWKVKHFPSVNIFADKKEPIDLFWIDFPKLTKNPQKITCEQSNWAHWRTCFLHLSMLDFLIHWILLTLHGKIIVCMPESLYGFSTNLLTKKCPRWKIPDSSANRKRCSSTGERRWIQIWSPKLKNVLLFPDSIRQIEWIKLRV